MVCQTLRVSSVVTAITHAVLMLFPTRPAACAAHVTHLSRHFRLNIQSPPPQGYFNHIWLSDTLPTSFSVCYLQCMIRESKTLDLHYANVKGQVKSFFKSLQRPTPLLLHTALCLLQDLILHQHGWLIMVREGKIQFFCVTIYLTKTLYVFQSQIFNDSHVVLQQEQQIFLCISCPTCKLNKKIH